MRLPSLLAVGCALLWPLAAAAQPCPQGTTFPTDTWLNQATEVRRSRPDAVRALEQYLFTQRGKPEDRVGFRTNSTVVVHQGRIIFERYANGWGPDQRHLTWSSSKSFLNPLVGMAVRDGRMNLDDSICTYREFSNKDACKVTVRHLLMWSSGFDWKETYENELPRASSVLAMLYGVGADDMARFTASHPMRDEPGTSYDYSSGDSTLLAGILAGAVEPVHGAHFPWKMLFDPLGMTTVTWERDAHGTFVGSSYLYASPRDLARFGLLYLRKGCWNQTRLVPEQWITESLQPNEAVKQKIITRDPTDIPGLHWWLNVPVPDKSIDKAWPDAPEDTFAARGHWGQSIFVVPTHDLVLVRTADDRDGTFDQNQYLKLAIDLVR